ncbi:hypothetical protein KC320_g54 [Hortaea werneckii]|nr:hypothetical protein KC320_g54 [Hortaea werneckii]
MAEKTLSAKKQQELQVQYSNYKDTLQAIAQKIGDVEQEGEEHKSLRSRNVRVQNLHSPPQLVLHDGRHTAPQAKPSMIEDKVSPANTSVRLVLETLTPLPGDRKCFRMINGVLVERTVSEVLPALQTNAEGLKKVLEDLVKQYRTKQEDMDNLIEKEQYSGVTKGYRQLNLEEISVRLDPEVLPTATWLSFGLYSRHMRGRLNSQAHELQAVRTKVMATFRDAYDDVWIRHDTLPEPARYVQVEEERALEIFT